MLSIFSNNFDDLVTFSINYCAKIVGESATWTESI